MWSCSCKGLFLNVGHYLNHFLWQHAAPIITLRVITSQHDIFRKFAISFQPLFTLKYLQPLPTRDVLLFSIMIVELRNDTQGKQNQSSSTLALCCLYKGPPQTHYSAKKGCFIYIYIFFYFFFYQITYLLKDHQFWPEHRPSLNVLQHHHEYLHELSANNKLNIIIFIIVINKTASCILCLETATLN